MKEPVGRKALGPESECEQGVDRLAGFDLAGHHQTDDRQVRFTQKKPRDHESPARFGDYGG